MIVIILEKVPTSVRGELTRWLLELQTGVFVGNVSALVRDKLWEMLCSKIKSKGGGMLLQPAATEQGYIIKTCGSTSRAIEDFEGLFLVRIP